jgi:branched-chain amino acid transport system substrate-binding protein
VFLLIVLFSPDGLLGWWATASKRLSSSGLGRAVRATGPAPEESTGVHHGRLTSRPERGADAAFTPKEGAMRTLTRQSGGTLAIALTAVLAAVGAAGTADAQSAVKIGLLATLEGPFAAGGQDGMRGAELAVKQRGGMVAGKKIEIIKASSDAKPDVAVNATRKLVEQDKVDIMVGPLSGSEGIAVKNYSKSQPNITFINGSSGAQATTLVDPSPNFFRFNTEGAQWMVGLGEYAFKTKGYKKMALIAEDYAFPYSQVQGFMTEYCKAGGRVTHKAWVPLGGKDYSSVIAGLPQDVDALLVVLGGADAVNFLTQYEQAGGNKPMVGGSITVDQTVLNFKGKRRESLLGTPSAGPIADSYEAPEWRQFVADYRANFKDGFPSPSLFAFVYYTNMKAALDGLEAVNGDLSGGQAKYREALKNLKLKTPTGVVTLDENRQAIGTTFVTEVAKSPDGVFYNKVVKVVPNVNQRLGMSKADFDKVGLGSRDVPNCP